MTERDRVLDAFRNCITEPKCKDCPWTECSTLDNGSVEIPHDLALAVMRELVAQEPRVMTLEELKNALMVEYRSGKTRLIGESLVEKKTEIFYGVIWRMWTSRPTNAQMEAVSWDS